MAYAQTVVNTLNRDLFSGIVLAYTGTPFPVLGQTMRRRGVTYVSVEDSVLFRESVVGTRIMKNQHADLAASRPKTVQRRISTPLMTTNANAPRLPARETMLASELPEILTLAKPGIQHRTIKKLQRGIFRVQASLDLHGLKLTEAEHELHQFITYAQQRGMQCVYVVHGKGNHSGGQSLLKKMVYAYMQQSALVMACSSALPQDGGTGAMYVLLKKQN